MVVDNCTKVPMYIVRLTRAHTDSPKWMYRGASGVYSSNNWRHAERFNSRKEAMEFIRDEISLLVYDRDELTVVEV